MGIHLPSETSIDNKGKELSEEELDDYFNFYEEWATGEWQDEVPELEEEDFIRICDMVEGLFEHIRCQKRTIDELIDTVRQMKALWEPLRKDVDGLKKLKRKSTNVDDDEDGRSPVKRVRRLRRK